MGTIVRNRKWIVLGGGFAAAVLAMSCAAWAEDFCNTTRIDFDKSAEAEKIVREKCKVGDIIFAEWGESVGRLCDIHQPVIPFSRSAICFLAPPRRTY